MAALAPFSVTVRAADSTIAESLKTAGDLSTLYAAVKTLRRPAQENYEQALRGCCH